jgi:hypothetical protein
MTTMVGRRVVVPLALFVIACGRSTEDVALPDVANADATDEAFDATDADARCDLVPFEQIVPITELDTADDDRDIRFTPDERTAVFRRSKGGPFLATRPSALQPLVIQPAQATGLPSFWTASLSTDARFLFYVCDISGPGFFLCYAERPDDTTAFDVSYEANVGDQRPGPFEWGDLDWGDGYVTGNLAAYYFMARTLGDAASVYAVFSAKRPASEATDGGILAPFASPQIVFTPDDTTFVDHPVVTSDELTLYVNTTTSTDPIPHVQMATRASVNDPFGALSPVSELDSVEGEYPTWISPDRCRLYLSRKVGGQWDLYVASRSPK